MINTHAPLLTTPTSLGVSYADSVLRKEMEFALEKKIRLQNEETKHASICAVVNTAALGCIGVGWLFPAVPLVAMSGIFAYQYWQKIDETNSVMKNVRKLSDFYIDEGFPPMDATAKAIDIYVMSKTDFEEKVSQATKKKNIFEISRGER